MNKVFNFLMGFIPLIVYTAINFMVFLVAHIYMGEGMADNPNLSKITMYLMVLIGGSGFVLFGLWYKGGFGKIQRTPLSLLFSVKGVIIILFLAACYQLSVTVLVSLSSAVFPNLVEDYSDMMNDFNSYNGFALVLYSSILAPITEELIFRGVTLNHFQKAVPFWLANILQALLFGIMHMNWIQGVYAFIMGMIFGLFYKRFNSLYVTILLHMAINSSGYIISVMSALPDMLSIVFIITAFISSFVSVVCLIEENKRIYKKRNSYNNL